MGDHARFIKGSLNPDQANSVLVAANFIEVYDRLLEKTRQLPSIKEPLLKEVLQITLSFRDFKRELLADRLRNMPVTSLAPAFYNHMLNELEDFLRVLADIEAGTEGPGSILGQHLLWSLDAAAHAAALGAGLDKVEYRLRNIALNYETSFDHLYLKIVEITGYYRSCPPSVEPVLEAYNGEMTEVMREFMKYLENLRIGITQHKIGGRLLPLHPDHMYREECYYLHKIAECQPGIAIPDCDPGRPRIAG